MFYAMSFPLYYCSWFCNIHTHLCTSFLFSPSIHSPPHTYTTLRLHRHRWHAFNASRTMHDSHQCSNGNNTRTAPPSRADESVVMTAAPALSRVSAFVRGMLQRFGIYQYIEAYQSKGGGSEGGSTTSGPSSNIQRGTPHRFRPHFVNTAKGLRNIPAQLNDGQLQLAPEDGVTGSDGSLVSGGQPGLQTGGGGAGSTTGSTSKAPGSSAGGGGTGGTISSLFNAFKRKVKAIYPGTVWCGDGNQAKSENDIGFFYLTDSCCRAHDLCPITIAAGEQFNRLKNNGYFTRSHCDCDKQFFNCLKNANTLVSRQIGYTYFNLLKPQCFRYEHPKLNCTKRSKGKCISYVVDEKQSKRWQWFDNLIF
ncbi:uncharacterized protein LOC120905811 isoform X3 [Anopheles arabiensis]|uniref:uncharacterized protein LOC120905811 isoform X3 n=1 Tax=Anopheles arabiensis TaxID=7173 RepID=UPI001AADFE94|nr:uncharacterized protein LOC120905811 isoform X3 [Anopheles arabiensis]